MSHLLYLLVTIPTMGRESQCFIGATWLAALARKCPRAVRRVIALYILGLSPHYFYRHADPRYSRMKYRDFLEAECARNAESRQRICDLLLTPFLSNEMCVLDYGCGPGWLSRAVAEKVKTVYAVDISDGVLECAQIINPRKNVKYLRADPIGFTAITDGSLDMVYSFAVIQHLTDEVFERLLGTCSRKLRGGGCLFLHLQLEDERGKWRSEAAWRGDRSLRGCVKLRFGMNSFARKSEDTQRLLEQHGFRVARIGKIADLCVQRFDDVCEQHFVLARKP